MTPGIQTRLSPHTVDDTVSRLQALLAAKGIKLFALIDHSGEALTVGLPMPNTKLLLFGNPKAGTPIMLAAPSAALDLPLRILVAQLPDGQTQLSWNDPAWLQHRHNFPDTLLPNLAAAGILAEAAAQMS